VAETTNGVPNNLEAAMAQGVTRLLSKKVGIVCFAIWGITQLVQPIVQATEPTVRYCLVGLGALIAMLAAYAFHGQTRLDLKEIEVTGKDQPDNNGNGHTENGTVVTP